MIASRVPATTTWMSERSSCSTVGLMTNRPSTRPTMTPPIGPLNGMSEMESAAEVPIMAEISGEQSWSTLMTMSTICTSFRKPSGNSGRIGRSVSRLARIALSLGRPSRLMNPPGILPTE